MHRTKVLTLLLAIIVLIHASHDEWCGADHHPPEHIYASGLYGEDSSNKRVLQASYENIRIETDFSFLSVADTDTYDYIKDKLVPATVNYFEKALKVKRLELLVSPSASICNNGITVPDEYKAPQGIEADLLIFVTATDEPGESFLAWAMTCVQDSVTNRPIIGQINYNVATTRIIATDDWYEYQDDLTTSMHELTHVLAMSSGLFPDYVNPDTNALITGHIETNWDLNGYDTTGLKIEPLLSYAQEYFDCPTLLAVPIENEGGSGSLGSHWERRVFYNEFMTSSQIKNTKITTFTMKLFEASGWYDPDYSMAEPAFWGKGRGCGFIDTKCLDGSQQPTYPEFCAGITSMGCSPTLLEVGVCGTWSATPSTNPSLDSAFNYWGNNTIINDPFADNCPYVIGYSNKNCEDSANQPDAWLDDEYYGTGSNCFSGAYGTSSSTVKGYCFKNRCEQQPDDSYHLIIEMGTDVVCTAAGPQAVPAPYTGNVDCPDPEEFCVTFKEIYCTRGCMGKGTCDTSTGECTCDCGWQGKDCSLVKDEECDEEEPTDPDDPDNPSNPSDPDDSDNENSSSKVEGPEKTVERAEKVEKAVKIESSVFLGLSLPLLIAAGNPIYFFRQLSVLQALIALNLLNLNYPASFETAIGFADIGKLDFIPNPFSWFVPSYDEAVTYAPKRFVRREMSGLFLKNSGQFLLILAVSGLIHLVAVALSRHLPGKVTNTVKDNLGLKLSFRVITWCSLILLASILVSLSEPNFDEPFYTVSYIASFASIIGFAIIPVYTTFTYRRFKKNKTAKDKSLGKREVLFEGYMNEDKSKISPFLTVIIVKNMAIIGLILALEDYPRTQVCASFAVSVLSTAILFKFKPSVLTREHRVDLITEVMLSVDKLFVLIFAFVYNDKSNYDSGKNTFGWVMTGLCIATIVFQQCYTLYGLFKFGKSLRQKFVPNQVTPRNLQTPNKVEDVSMIGNQSSQFNLDLSVSPDKSPHKSLRITPFNKHASNIDDLIEIDASKMGGDTSRLDLNGPSIKSNLNTGRANNTPVPEMNSDYSPSINSMKYYK